MKRRVRVLCHFRRQQYCTSAASSSFLEMHPFFSLSFWALLGIKRAWEIEVSALSQMSISISLSLYFTGPFSPVKKEKERRRRFLPLSSEEAPAVPNGRADSPGNPLFTAKHWRICNFPYIHQEQVCLLYLQLANFHHAKIDARCSRGKGNCISSLHPPFHLSRRKKREEIPIYSGRISFPFPPQTTAANFFVAISHDSSEEKREEIFGF